MAVDASEELRRWRAWGDGGGGRNEEGVGAALRPSVKVSGKGGGTGIVFCERLKRLSIAHSSSLFPGIVGGELHLLLFDWLSRGFEAAAALSDVCCWCCCCCLLSFSLATRLIASCRSSCLCSVFVALS